MVSSGVGDGCCGVGSRGQCSGTLLAIGRQHSPGMAFTHPVTVQTCGDLRAIRPLTEGQPSTEFALQADSSPQT